MSEETKSEKQLLLAEHKKANDALRELKALQAAISFMVIPNFIVPTQPSDATVANLIKISDRIPQYMDILSNYLSNQFKLIMKSNDKVKQLNLRPIKVKGFNNKEDHMAAKKKSSAKPAKKKSAKKATAKATTTKRK